MPVSATTKANICYTSYCSGGSTIKCTSCDGQGKYIKHDFYYTHFNVSSTETNNRNRYCPVHEIVDTHSEGRVGQIWFCCTREGTKRFCVTSYNRQNYPDVKHAYAKFPSGCTGRHLCRMWWIGSSTYILLSRSDHCPPLLFTLYKHDSRFTWILIR